MMTKVAVIGKIRSGKDSFAKTFIDAGYKEFKFQDGINLVIDTFFPGARKEGKPRKLYQQIGQHMRAIDGDVWVRYTFNEIAEYEQYMKPFDSRVIITDVRQENEINHLREAGYTIIKVDASLETRIARMKAAGDNFNIEDLNHETEQYADIVVPDILVKNEGTLDQLFLDAGRVMRHIDAVARGYK